MLKNKTKLFSIILALAIIFTSTFAFADEGTTENNQSSPEAPVTATEAQTNQSSETTNTTNTASTNQSTSNMKKSDVYITGDDVTIDYVVDGNLFVMANNVTISSQVGGDAFICAKNVTVSEQGYVYSNLFVAAESVNIKGIVYDIYAATKSLTISGYVYRDVRAVAQDNLTILGTVGRNAYVGYTPNINFTSSESEASGATGAITGNLEYSAQQELSIPSEQIGGEVKFNQISTQTENKAENENIFLTYLTKLGSSLGLLVIVWLLGLWLAPKFLKETDKLLKTKTLPIFGFGILGLILIPIVSLILLFINITSLAAITLILLYIAAFIIGTSVSQIAISNIASEKLKIDKTIGQLGVLILTGIIVWAICLIPVLGGIISAILSIFGFGIIIKYILPCKNCKNMPNTAKK